MTTINGLIILNREIPADFRASNSFFSPKLPNAIMEASSTDNGRARGTQLADAYKRSSKMIFDSSPLPIKSSTYSHRNCMSSMSIQIIKLSRNGPLNEDMIIHPILFILND